MKKRSQSAVVSPANFRMGLLVMTTAACAFAPAAGAALLAPYEPDANTVALYRFSEASGPIINHGTGGAALDLTNTGGAAGRSGTTGGGYGAPAPSGFGSAFDILAAGDGTYHATTTPTTPNGGGLITAPAAQSTLQGASGAFTYEALILLKDGMLKEQNIIAHDGPNESRGFLFRVISPATGPLAGQGTLGFFTGTDQHHAAIPTTGEHAFASDQWYHVAVTYTGEQGVANNLTFYWTGLESGAAAANAIGTSTMTADLANSTNLLGIGTTTRQAFRFEIDGLVDEVRISNIARGADDFLFIPEPGSTALFGFGLLMMACRRKRTA